MKLSALTLLTLIITVLATPLTPLKINLSQPSDASAHLSKRTEDDIAHVYLDRHGKKQECLKPSKCLTTKAWTQTCTDYCSKQGGSLTLAEVYRCGTSKDQYQCCCKQKKK